MTVLCGFLFLHHSGKCRICPLSIDQITLALCWLMQRLLVGKAKHIQLVLFVPSSLFKMSWMFKSAVYSRGEPHMVEMLFLIDVFTLVEVRVDMILLTLYPASAIFYSLLLLACS